tara:strand:+ start:483 stop:3137 length:2655 start_codon:yes stop_codon:yes gene_type:complete
MATLNFNSGNNIIIPSENNTTYRGLEGDDTYIISKAAIKDSKIKIIDTEGTNKIQIVEGITVSSSIFTSNAARLILSNGTEITISGADKFTFEAGGNLTSATLGTDRSYLNFADAMGAYYASFKTDEGDGGITINNSYDMRLVKNSTVKTIILGNHFDGENVKYSIIKSEYPNQYNYSQSFISDQITLSDGQLKAQGGVGDEIYTTKITVQGENQNTGNLSEKVFTFRLTDDDEIKKSSSKIISSSDTETVISISEDTMGDRLLDLSSFEIDEGSAKITSVSIGGSVTPISYFSTDPWAQDGWQDYFYINKNVLKFAQYSYYDYDTDEYKLFLGPAIYGSDWQFHDLTTSNVRDNEFSITFEYKNNGKLKTHKVVIDSYSNNLNGPIDAIPDGDRVKEVTNSSDNNINALLFSNWQWANKNNFEITEITFAFPPSNDTHNVMPWVSKPSASFWELGDSRDTHIDSEEFKGAVRGVLNTTEKMFNVKFTELTQDNYNKADLRYILFETSDDAGNSQAWHPSPENHSYIYLRTYYGGKYTDFSVGSIMYETILHETGHALNLAHPFDGTKIESSQNTLLFSIMAYDAFWLRTTDTYGIASGNGSGIYKGDTEDNENSLNQSSWNLHDINALGHMYGYRTNYKSEDTIYTFSPSINIYQTIHDMGGNDTIDLSNYTENTTISLIPGGVSEVGSNKIFWAGDSQQSGDFFVLSSHTDIEKYIGSSGNDDLTLNTLIINDVSTGAGDDVIRDVLPTDIVNTGAGADTVYISYTTLDQDTSLNINGGLGSSYFDWIIIDLAPDTEKDFTLCRTAFVNFEGFDFTDNEDQIIVLDTDDFSSINSQTLSLKGDNIDKVVLPEGASETRNDDIYVYYSLNNIEIAIADNMMIG